MMTVYSEKHLLRNARTELYRGELVPPHECAARAEFVLDRIKATGLGDIVPPDAFGLDPVRRVHDAQFVEFLSSVWKDWLAEGGKGEAIPDSWPARRMAQRIPDSTAGKLGYYAMAAETSISE